MKTILFAGFVGIAVSAQALPVFAHNHETADEATAAEAAEVQTATAGFYRFQVGDLTVTALSDGTVKLPVDQLLKGMPTTQIERQLAYYYQTTPLETSVNGYVVQDGTHTVLIDAGAAGLFGPTLGKLQQNLAAAGINANAVDEVYLTHLHPDHVGGLLHNSQPAFPNTRIRVAQADYDFWLNEAKMNAAAESDKGFFQGAMLSLQPYIEQGKVVPFTADETLLASVKAINNHGHTPGHTVYSIASQGEKLLFWGDLMHVAAVQFEYPRVTIAFDSDQAQARAQRLKVFAEVAREGYLVAGAHLSFPGVGRLRAQQDGYEFIPLNFSPAGFVE